MNEHDFETHKISVIGAGNVGTTYAYSLLLSGLASEIVLIDANRVKAEGEAMDLNHAVPFTKPTRIYAGTYQDVKGSDIVIVTAGASQKPGESRLDLVQKNYQIFQQIIPQIVENNPNGILVIATNPVDVLSYAAWKISGLPENRVIGSGTILDTARFRYLLSQHAGVDPRSVHAYIAGEHGDSEVPLWSLANIAGMRLQDYCKANCISFEPQVWENIYQQTKDAAYEIIQRKGATFYAVASGLVRITEAILRDQNTVLSVSTLVNDFHGIDQVYFSLPAVVGRKGVERRLNLELNETEIDGIKRSAGILKETIAQVGIK